MCRVLTVLFTEIIIQNSENKLENAQKYHDKLHNSLASIGLLTVVKTESSGIDFFGCSDDWWLASDDMPSVHCI